MNTAQRPNINTIVRGSELKKWYWLKAELIALCKAKNISYTGTKFQILDRLADFLDHGEVKRSKKVGTKASFNWKIATLTKKTIITENYSNGQNSRAFFKIHCGDKFKFSIAFMAWMKANVGKPLGAAVEEWKRLEMEKKKKGFKSKIPSSNQYNQYLRDFFADNPGLSMAEVRKYWKLKRALPLQYHVYERSDLKLS